MKHCPKCNTDYFDNILEYCMEDGERLVEVSLKDSEIEANPTVQTSGRKTEVETFSFNAKDYTRDELTPEYKTAPQNQLNQKTASIKEQAWNHWLKFLELFPIVLALFHNYWQWLYLENQSYYNVTDFLTSKVFLFWLFLLISGIIFGMISLKFSKNKSISIVSLIILAINLILSIVPK